MAAPSVKDLPKMDETIQQEVAKEHNLKHVETTEKVVLPTADDVKQEKTHQGLIQGVEGFTPEKLKKVNTREPASGADGKYLLDKKSMLLENSANKSFMHTRAKNNFLSRNCQQLDVKNVNLVKIRF